MNAIKPRAQSEISHFVRRKNSITEVHHKPFEKNALNESPSLSTAATSTLTQSDYIAWKVL